MHKNRLAFFFTIGLLCFFFSCETEEPDGRWGDIIKLSAKKVDFKATSDSVVITTKGNWWWIDDITLNNQSTGKNCLTASDSTYFLIQDSCFVVERRDKNTLFIKMDENPGRIKRILEVYLEAGDYFDHIQITQSAK